MLLHFLRDSQNKILSKKPIVKIFFALILLGSIVVLVVSLTAIANDYKNLKKAEARIKVNPDWLQLWENAKQGRSLLANPQDEEAYLAAAFRWKSLADLTGEKIFYLKARHIYDLAIARKDLKTAYLSILNAGNISRTLKEFETADEYYLKAISMNPGEAGTYITRAELLRYDLKRDPQIIKEFYTKSLSILIGQEYVRLASDYAFYLKSSGNFGEALKQYKLLLLVMPSYEPYATAIKEIEEEQGRAGKNQSNAP